MSGLVKIPLGRNFTDRDRVGVKLVTDEGGLHDVIEVVALDGRARFGRIEQVEFREVKRARWWWPTPKRFTQRKIRVRFERRPNPSQ